jgi:maleate cis-trans isomerase
VIDYGSRLRLGVIVPSGNVIAEPQIHAMLPKGVVAYMTRLELRGSSEPELLEMSRHVEAGAKLLSDAQVDAVVFHCTAVSTFSPSMGEDIECRIANASGLPAISTSEAILTALRALNAKKIVLLTPYIDSVNAREVAFLEHHGFEVLEEVGLGVDTNAEMAKLPPQIWVDLARKHQCEDADAYFISCTAVRSAEVIEEIEALVGRPVITSNQAMVWYALRKNTIADHQPGFGSLFSVTTI